MSVREQLDATNSLFLWRSQMKKEEICRSINWTTAPSSHIHHTSAFKLCLLSSPSGFPCSSSIVLKSLSTCPFPLPYSISWLRPSSALSPAKSFFFMYKLSWSPTSSYRMQPSPSELNFLLPLIEHLKVHSKFQKSSINFRIAHAQGGCIW